jgi:hypothetical protein
MLELLVRAGRPPAKGSRNARERRYRGGESCPSVITLHSSLRHSRCAFLRRGRRGGSGCARRRWSLPYCWRATGAVAPSRGLGRGIFSAAARGRESASRGCGPDPTRNSTSIPSFVPPGSCIRSEWPWVPSYSRKDIAAFNRSSCSCWVLLVAITGNPSRKRSLFGYSSSACKYGPSRISGSGCNLSMMQNTPLARAKFTG